MAEIKYEAVRYTNSVYNSDSDQSDIQNEQKGSGLKINENFETLCVISSTENPTELTTVAKLDQKGNLTELPIDKKEVISFFKRIDQNKAFICHCYATTSEEGVLLKESCLPNISSMKCKTCKEKMKVNPCWKFDEYTDVKKEIFRFLRYQNPTTTLCSNDDCKADDEAHIIPTRRDYFGIVTSVGCVKCDTNMSLEITTVNRNKLTMIEDVNELQPGNELMFRRWYGISHHAIYLGEAEAKEDDATNGQNIRYTRLTENESAETENESAESVNKVGRCSCCNKCLRSLRSSKVLVRVISPTFDEEDARVIETEELVDGNDVYRVEYDSCYPPKWTLGNAMSAKEFAKVCRDQVEQLSDDRIESNYDPFMENCEHFARRCKTGQSESRQVKTCLYNCGTNIAMLALRITFLAIWWASLAAVDAYEKAFAHYIKNMTAVIPCVKENEKITRMELAVAISLSILLLTVNVVLSSIAECRKMIRRQEPSAYYPEVGRCGISCYRCCCKCCPKKCYGFRYLCRLLFCLVPIHICRKMSCSGLSRCSCECKQCCDEAILKSCCRIYAAITIRVVITETIVIGIPIVFFVNIVLVCNQNANSSLTWATRGFIYTLPLVLVLSFIQSSIATIVGRVTNYICRRCCCCCYCCCSFKVGLSRNL